MFTYRPQIKWFVIIKSGRMLPQGFIRLYYGFDETNTLLLLYTLTILVQAFIKLKNYY